MRRSHGRIAELPEPPVNGGLGYCILAESVPRPGLRERCVRQAQQGSRHTLLGRAYPLLRRSLVSLRPLTRVHGTDTRHAAASQTWATLRGGKPNPLSSAR